VLSRFIFNKYCGICLFDYLSRK